MPSPTISPSVMKPLRPGLPPRTGSSSFTAKEGMMIGYHATLLRNMKSIMEKGLTPQLGERCRDIGEKDPALYFFPTRDDAENAISNWLGDDFEDRYGSARMVLLTVEIPHQDYDIQGFPEIIVPHPIHAASILACDDMG